MVDPASARRRVARALVFAALMSVTAVAAHALAGGMVPTPRVVATSTAVVAAVAWTLAGRRRHGAALVAAAVAGQLGLHAAYALTMRSAMQAHALSAVLCGSPHGHPMTHMTGLPAPHEAVWSVGWMTVAHCAAAAATVLVARHGEDLASLLARVLRAVWTFDEPARGPLPQTRAVPRPRRTAVLIGLRWARGPRLRGPPLRCA